MERVELGGAGPLNELVFNRSPSTEIFTLLPPLAMSSLPVFANTLSKLHADIAIIRLIRAGIVADKISAVFPPGRAPNSVCCWLKHFHRIPFLTSLPMAAAGVLGMVFRQGAKSAEVEQELDELGLNRELTRRIFERTDAGRIVICVHARNEAEAAIAWHIFHHVGAEDITGATRETFPARAESHSLAPQWAGLAA